MAAVAGNTGIPQPIQTTTNQRQAAQNAAVAASMAGFDARQRQIANSRAGSNARVAQPATPLSLPPSAAMPESLGPAPVVEPKPSAPASPASLAGLDVAMGDGGSDGSGFVGTPQVGLRNLGRRTPPMDSMALAAVAGSIY